MCANNKLLLEFRSVAICQASETKPFANPVLQAPFVWPSHHGALAELHEDAPSTTMLDQARVIDNGRFILSAGISVGIDAALYTVAQRQGPEQAIETVTYMEYDWHHRTVDGSTIVKAGA